MRKGILFAIGAYVLWGLFPLYWKQLQAIPAKEIVAHRIVWSFVFLGIIISSKRRILEILKTIRKPRIIAIYTCSALLIFANWLTYIWAVNSGYIVDASLGYFINPLVSVVLGIIFFRERLRIGQWIAILLACAGVGYLTFKYGALPWIGLVLAFSFGTYGLIKKLAPLEALEGQTIEMAFLSILALPFLLYLEKHHVGSFIHAGLTPTILLILGGAVTAIPLLMFSAAARQIPLSMIGILQYLAPSLQFSIGVWVYGEGFPPYKLVGYSLIWSALLVYTVEGLRHQQKSRKAMACPEIPPT